MRLQRDHDIILNAGLARIRHAARPHGERFTAATQRDAVGLHGSEMRPACDDGDIGAGFRQPRRHQPADGAGAENPNAHQPSPSFCASPMRCNFPVAPLGISSRNTIRRGTL